MNTENERKQTPISLVWDTVEDGWGNKFPENVLQTLKKKFNIKVHHKSELAAVALATVDETDFSRMDDFAKSEYKGKLEVGYFG